MTRQYIGKVDVQLNSNHSIFTRYMLTTQEVTPPLRAEPGKHPRLDAGRQRVQGGSLADHRRHDGAEQHHGQFAAHRCELHRHSPHARADWFRHHRMSASTPSAIFEDYMLLERHRRLQPRRRHRKRGAVQDAVLSGDRRPHDDPGQPPVRRRRQPGVLAVAVARQRPVAGPVQRSTPRIRPGSALPTS